MFYRALRPVLYSLPPEQAHHIAFGALRRLAKAPGGLAVLSRLFSPRSDANLRVQRMGLSFAHPVGLAAGFDKDGIGYEALGAAGFSFVEIGTLTAHTQAGNQKPRLFRLERDDALINRMGFNNGGSAAAAERLRNRKSGGTILGINIGKSKKTPEAEAAGDYALSTRRLAEYADYLVVNVSSPNTPGLRNLQSVEKLAPILTAVRAAADEVRDSHVPLLVKIAPDLADEDVDAVAQLVSAVNLDGVIATNTTISRAGLRTPAHKVQTFGAGGLSGAPLKKRALEVTRRLRAGLGPDKTLIGVGGIETADDAWERLIAGADLLQIYTSYIYNGPTAPRDLAEGIAARLRTQSCSLVDLCGVNSPDTRTI